MTGHAGLKNRPADAHTLQTHPNLDQHKSIRYRKKPAHLANYVCTIKADRISPKKARGPNTRCKVLTPTSRDSLPLEGAHRQLAEYCYSLLPDASVYYDEGQTMTSIANRPLTNMNNTVRYCLSNALGSSCVGHTIKLLGPIACRMSCVMCL